MYHDGQHLSLRNTAFENNTCAEDGGAVYVKSSPLADGSWADGEGVDILACSFKNNTSSYSGGAVYYQGSLGETNEAMIVRGTLFVGNTAASGGALCAWGADRLAVNESTFEQNTAVFGHGGGIYTYGQ